ncbi:Sodium:neurotransmitter symporter family protein [Dictyocaulus viviparus]|uniref:Sodium:neurotransmitter symporter family protein n=1 Tax=Dictyocaulus viviparus TaxID=29172 RepID=A0A0D8XD26_DICVI|nr:Sodium:neurotransmitter symporter family protein [Dictyocaulus viviparus]
MIYLCVMKGIKSSGKVSCTSVCLIVYLLTGFPSDTQHSSVTYDVHYKCIFVMYATATFPYLVTTIFLVRSVTLDGAMRGLWHMINPDLHKLYSPTVWLEAATQIFYSMGLGFGGEEMAIMQSVFPEKFATVDDVRRTFTTEQYISLMENKFTGEYTKMTAHSQMCNYETIISELMENKFTGEYTKMTAHSQMCNYETIISEAAEGTGLAFVVFTEAILKFPFPPAWSILFFLMLLSLGLGSMFGTLEGVITSLNDSHLITVSKPVLTAVLCGSACTIGLLFSTRAGQYWVALFDSFAGSYALMCVAFFEVIAVVYIYGYRRFSGDIDFMTGSTPGQYWLVTWRFIAPIIMAVLFTCSVVQCFSKAITYYAYNRETTKQQETEYPIWAMFIALTMVLLAILPTFSVWFLRYFKIWKLEADIPAASKCLGTTQSTTYMLKSEQSFNRMTESNVSVAEMGPIAIPR